MRSKRKKATNVVTTLPGTGNRASAEAAPPATAPHPGSVPLATAMTCMPATGRAEFLGFKMVSTSFNPQGRGTNPLHSGYISGGGSGNHLKEPQTHRESRCHLQLSPFKRHQHQLPNYRETTRTPPNATCRRFAGLRHAPASSWCRPACPRHRTARRPPKGQGWKKSAALR